MKRILIILILLTGETTLASELHISLLPEAAVQSDVVVLADLLPQNVPGSIKSAAGKISLGHAPQSGTTRRIPREFIQRAMQDMEFPSVKILIPESITIHRKSRIITREEVFAAIQTKLMKSSSPELQKIQPQDLTLEPAMQVPPGDAHLKVSQISFDQSVERVRFRLESESIPTLLPFYATAHVHHAVAEVALNREAAIKQENRESQKTAPEPMLVEAGHYAYLHLHSQSSEMTLEVKTLQSGHLGDEVRIRMPLNAKIWQARVVGKESLDAAF